MEPPPNLMRSSRSIGICTTTMRMTLQQLFRASPALLSSPAISSPPFSSRRSLQTTRAFSSTPSRFSSSSSSFVHQPSPPRLPPDQQAEFERLQRAAEAQLSSHTKINITTAEHQELSSPLATSRHVTQPSSSSLSSPSSSSSSPPPTNVDTRDLEATFSGGIRKGAPPEFSGDKNPKTGEVGGPKNEPLRWGSVGDWSYNGRVTDF
jgi:hypothetical protein